MRWKAAGRGSNVIRYREFDTEEDANAAIREAHRSFPGLYARFTLVPERGRGGRRFVKVRAFTTPSEGRPPGFWQFL